MSNEKEIVSSICDLSQQRGLSSFGKLYRFIPDEDAAAEGLIRLIDESGEEYAFEAKRFHVMSVPPAVKKALLTESQS